MKTTARLPAKLPYIFYEELHDVPADLVVLRILGNERGLVLIFCLVNFLQHAVYHQFLPSFR